ncbi:hypothetical protein JCM19274_2760 [Algibacter lectus]|uniref:Alpha-L-fucosidase C-terminal domain-containing protein n=1 Tax=Algibacter lectus TaxID=221126 RepID=A0A090X1V8_9FLAO|nr:hypothetical protein [Algibacter lectus]GAL82049.1 hypothetical protein JCM19274_2760 [Algibacter lectus]
MGDWIHVNGEGIYESRPYDYYGEDAIRYTRNGKTIYAFVNTEMLNKNVITLNLSSTKITEIKQLGVNEKIDWELIGNKVNITAHPPSSFPVITFKIN